MTDLPYVGEIRALHGEIVVGWAFRPERPDERVVVEILCDGYPVTLATADMFEADLRDRGIGDGCHAFVAALPARILVACSRITARIANEGTALSGALSPRARRAEGAVPLRGEVRSDGGLRLTGWVWDSSRPDHHLNLRIMEGNRQVAAVTANERRADLVAARIGGGDHGFTVWLPLDFADGHPHQVRVIDEEGAEIAGSPAVVLACSPGASALLRRALEGLAMPPGPELADTLSVIEQQLRSYERLLPRSAGFSDYAAWHRAFDSSRTVEAGPGTAGARFMILVHGSGDAAATVRSLQGQTHGNWRAVLEKPAGAAGPADIRVSFPSSTGWSDTWRRVGASATDILVPVRAGDRLPEHALARLAAAFADAAVDIVYSDCDQDTADGGRADPWFKPAWDPDLFLSQDYLLDLFAARCSLYQGCPEAVGAADLPFLAVEAVRAGPHGEAAIQHIPEILCHRSADARPGRGSDAGRRQPGGGSASPWAGRARRHRRTAGRHALAPAHPPAPAGAAPAGQHHHSDAGQARSAVGLYFERSGAHDLPGVRDPHRRQPVERPCHVPVLRRGCRPRCPHSALHQPVQLRRDQQRRRGRGARLGRLPAQQRRRGDHTGVARGDGRHSCCARGLEPSAPSCSGPMAWFSTVVW